MSWVEVVTQAWFETLLWVSGLAVLFGILAQLMPCNAGMFWWKDARAVVTDLLYWFAVPLLMRNVRTLLFSFGVALTLRGWDPDQSSLRSWPMWVQCLAVLLVQDLYLYWAHRLFHTRTGWGFHAVHHSPTTLDWTATARFHPVNHLLEFAVADFLVLAMGYSPMTLVLLTPFNIVYSAMVHANLNWTFGPLRYVFASPVFHRWHHTTEIEGRDKNFAPTFPLLDVIFGSFYMPPGRVPEQFGSGDPHFPADLFGQLVYPVYRAKVPSTKVEEQVPSRKAA